MSKTAETREVVKAIRAEIRRELKLNAECQRNMQWMGVSECSGKLAALRFCLNLISGCPKAGTKRGAGK